VGMVRGGWGLVGVGVIVIIIVIAIVSMTTIIITSISQPITIIHHTTNTIFTTPITPHTILLIPQPHSHPLLNPLNPTLFDQQPYFLHPYLAPTNTPPFRPLPLPLPLHPTPNRIHRQEPHMIHILSTIL
jgi:hypothetical protein